MVFRIGSKNAVIIRLSAPIKSHWAKCNNLVLDELLSSTNYKEDHRKAMIEWGEKIRNNDFGYFCKAAIDMTTGDQSIYFIFFSTFCGRIEILYN